MRVSREKVFGIEQILTLTMLFLFGMNLFNQYFYFIFLAFAICLFFNVNHLKVDSLFLILTLFSISYLLFYPSIRSSTTNIIKQFSYPICYTIGFNFIRKSDSEQNGLRQTEKQIERSIIVIAIGYFIHYLLNLTQNWQSSVRNTMDIWTGEVSTATSQAALAIIPLAVFVATAFSKSKTYLRIISVIGILLVFMYNLVLSGRTILFMGLLIFAIAFAYTVKRSELKHKFSVTAAVFAVSVLLVLVYTYDLAGIRTFILGSNLSKRFELYSLLEDSRINKKILYIKNFISYPFGGGKLREALSGQYAHELYLDVYSDTGIIGYALVITFVLSSVIRIVKLLRTGRFSDYFNLLVMCVYAIILIEFFVEPIIQGVPWLFCVFCFFTGLLNCCSAQVKSQGETA